MLMYLKKWRRKRDSNPRYPFEYNGFQDRRLKPLGHSSAFYCNRLAAGQTQQALGVAAVDTVLVGGAEAQAFDHPDGLPDVQARRGLVRRVGGEQHVIKAEESQAALRGRQCPEERGVGVEYLEVIVGALLHGFQQLFVALIGTAP